MMLFSLLWLVIGLCMGLISLVARFQPVGWTGLYQRLTVLLLGGITGWGGGWLGAWLFGRLFASATALWVAGFFIIVIPWSVSRWFKKL